jgi:hypothetical protein
MADAHASYDALVALALDDREERDWGAGQHLAGCGHCRARYDDVLAGIEQVLAATPPIDPPPGFDQRVLTAMGLAPAGPPVAAGPVPRRTPRRRAPLVAAAAVLGVLLGVGGTLIWTGQDEGRDPPGGAAAATLDTSEGESVGSVTRSFLEGEPVMVVRVTDGVVGKSYECLLVLDDGRSRAVGRWVMEAPEATWVVPAPPSGVDAVRLVTGEGRVWSAADLPDGG